MAPVSVLTGFDCSSIEHYALVNDLYPSFNCVLSSQIMHFNTIVLSRKMVKNKCNSSYL